MCQTGRSGKTTRPRGGSAKEEDCALPGGTLRRMGARRRVVVLGAAGRDFHDFNVVYRDDPAVEVVAFTAAQIPGIAGRRYPAALAGPLYPDGHPDRGRGGARGALPARAASTRSSSPTATSSHAQVMHLASRALAAGADFVAARARAHDARGARAR